jgi:CheY-like chemotaxis protein
MIARILAGQHDLVTAGSGLEAQAILLHDQSFDVILCDLMMPEMTGMDLHKWLATHHPLLAERVIFMTGGAFTPKASDYVARVGNVRLEKPFQAVQLQQLISELVAAPASTG